MGDSWRAWSEEAIMKEPGSGQEQLGSIMQATVSWPTEKAGN